MKIAIDNPNAIQEMGSRKNQEDSIFPLKGEATVEDRVFILCDGMGGHEKGEVASQLVCEVVSSYLHKNWTGGVLSDGLLNEALDEMFLRINEYDNGTMRQMGTTLTLVVFHQGGVTMAYIGDSRIYHVRPSEHRFLYKSRDHSLVYDLFLAGEIKQEEMLSNARKNVITKAVTPNQEWQPNADIAHTTDVMAGDYFLLCSDGMLEQMDDQQLLMILCGEETDEQKCERLIRETKDNNDNHSAWLIKVNHVAAEPEDTAQPNDEHQTKSNALLLERVSSPTQQDSDSLPFWTRVKNWFSL